MTTRRALLFSLLSAFALGCPDWNMHERFNPDSEGLSFGYRSNNLHMPIEAGEWGSAVWILISPEFSPLPRSNAILKGPGKLYYVRWGSGLDSNGLAVQVETPWEEIADTYYSNGMYLYYRPPSNEDVPPEGVDVTFACEVQNPMTKQWERSPDYARRVVRRDRPMDFFFRPEFTYEDPEYGPDNSFSDATVVSGETRRSLTLFTQPVPADDIQLQISLSGPNGYTGHLGALEMYRYEFNFGQPKNRTYSYTAPADLTEPVDIVAKFSILDPWTKETRTRELTFHVVPKGQGD